MRVRLLTSVKDGSGWHEPGVIRDFSDEDARSLIRSKSAEAVSAIPSNIIPSVEIESVESEKDVYSDEELREMADALKQIDGVDEEIAYRLLEAGFHDVQSVAEAERDVLIAIKGIGKKNVTKIQESAEDLVDFQS